jgi:hypothetical protein
MMGGKNVMGGGNQMPNGGIMTLEQMKLDRGDDADHFDPFYNPGAV